MSFLRRLRFYLIGFGIGLLFVAFFFGSKAAQCSYLPNSRTLEEAKIYPIVYSDEANEFIKSEKLDSIFVYDELFGKSEITNFGTDEVRAEPCRIYRAIYRKQKSYDFVFEICNKKETKLTEIKKSGE